VHYQNQHLTSVHQERIALLRPGGRNLGHGNRVVSARRPFSDARPSYERWFTPHHSPIRLYHGDGGDGRIVEDGETAVGPVVDVAWGAAAGGLRFGFQDCVLEGLLPDHHIHETQLYSRQDRTLLGVSVSAASRTILRPLSRLPRRKSRPSAGAPPGTDEDWLLRTGVRQRGRNPD